MTAWWWLSFCDPDRPEGEQFLGVALVQAEDEYGVAPAAWVAGCNPGGEIGMMRIPDKVPVPVEYQHRLLSRAEAAKLDALWKARLGCATCGHPEGSHEGRCYGGHDDGEPCGCDGAYTPATEAT